MNRCLIRLQQVEILNVRIYNTNKLEMLSFVSMIIRCITIAVYSLFPARVFPYSFFKNIFCISGKEMYVFVNQRVSCVPKRGWVKCIVTQKYKYVCMI